MITGYISIVVLTICLLATAAQSILVLREIGVTSLGHGALLGLVTYSIVVLSIRASFLIAIVVVVLTMLGLSICFAWCGELLDNVSMSVSTILLHLIFAPLVVHFTTITGGVSGLRIPADTIPRLSTGDAISLTLVQLLLVWRVYDSNFGTLGRAIGDDRSYAKVIGVNVHSVSAVSWVIALVMLVLPSMLYLSVTPVVDTASFDIQLSMILLVVAGLGNRHLALGAIGAAALYRGLVEVIEVIPSGNMEEEKLAAIIVAVFLIVLTTHREKRLRHKLGIRKIV